MARKKSASSPSPAPSAVASTIYQATLGGSEAVVRVQPPITQAQAELLRQAGQDVVVCGPNHAANLARMIEQNANDPYKRCPPHARAGPHALPHYQPEPRNHLTGHTFYETANRHAF